MNQLEELIIKFDKENYWSCDILMHLARNFRYVCTNDKKILIKDRSKKKLEGEFEEMSFWPIQIQFQQKQFRCHLL